LKSLINFLGSGFSLFGSSPGLSSGSLGFLGKFAEDFSAFRLFTVIVWEFLVSFLGNIVKGIASSEHEVIDGESCSLQAIFKIHDEIGIFRATPFQLTSVDVP